MTENEHNVKIIAMLVGELTKIANHETLYYEFDECYYEVKEIASHAIVSYKKEKAIRNDKRAIETRKKEN